MKYLILIDLAEWRDASSVEHATLLLADLRPELPAEVLSIDGREYYRWNRERLQLEKQDVAYVLRSDAERGYWNNQLGWSHQLSNASRYAPEQFHTINFPQTGLKDAKLVLLDSTLKDFSLE